MQPIKFASREGILAYAGTPVLLSGPVILNCSAAAVIRNTKFVGAVGDLEIAVGCVVITDEAQAVGPDGPGVVSAAVTVAGHGGEGSGSAGFVGAVGHLEIAVGLIVIADEAQAVGPDGH